MTTGHKATGAGLGTTPPDAGAGLTGEWIAATRGRPGAGARAGPAVRALAGDDRRPRRAAQRGAQPGAAGPLGGGGRGAPRGRRRARAACWAPTTPTPSPAATRSPSPSAAPAAPPTRCSEYKQVPPPGPGRWAPTTPTPSPPGRKWRTSWASWAATSRRTRCTRRCSPPGSARMGPDHPDTLRCRHNLAFNLSRLGRLEDSYRMACEVAAARARVLGAGPPRHPGHPLRSRLRAGPVGPLAGGPADLPRGRRGPRPGARPRPPRHPRRPLRGRHQPRPARPQRGGPGASTAT